MTTTRELICFKCKHYRLFDGGCDAFPDGIPDQILLTNKHSKPIPNQGNKIVFEEKTDQDELFNIG